MTASPPAGPETGSVSDAPRSSAALYTPELLALAVELARYPFAGDWQAYGSARSQNCGSTITLGCDFDELGRITKIGMQVSACAIGQASAAIYARNTIGLSRSDIAGRAAMLGDWLGGRADPPAWDGFSPIISARAFPGRHGAILLPWQAALAALPIAESER